MIIELGLGLSAAAVGMYVSYRLGMQKTSADTGKSAETKTKKSIKTSKSDDTESPRLAKGYSPKTANEKILLFKESKEGETESP